MRRWSNAESSHQRGLVAACVEFGRANAQLQRGADQLALRGVKSSELAAIIRRSWIPVGAH